MCNSARAASQLAPTTTTATSPRPRTGRTSGAKAARAGRHGQGAGRGRPAARPTSTELRHTNVPFSHPSDLYPQKDGRKVRSRGKGTFTFRPAPRGRPDVAWRRRYSSACSCRSTRAPGRGVATAVFIGVLLPLHAGARTCQMSSPIGCSTAGSLRGAPVDRGVRRTLRTAAGAFRPRRPRQSLSPSRSVRFRLGIGPGELGAPAAGYQSALGLSKTPLSKTPKTPRRPTWNHLFRPTHDRDP